MLSHLNNQKIAVLMGGPGNERPVSLASGKGVAEALRHLGAEVTEVDVTGPNFILPEGVDLAFNVIHGTFGEDGQIQRILESLKIPYTGEGIAESELAIDKIATKNALIAARVPTPAFEILAQGTRPTLELPFVVKAPREGSSVGIFVVKHPEEVDSVMTNAWKFGDQLLVEQFVDGRELTVGIIGDQALPVIEIRPKKAGEFYDFANKYHFLNPSAAGADHFCPAALSDELRERVQSLAIAAKNALGLKVYSRVDILLPENQQPVVLEINTIPGMTSASLLPEAAAAAGIGYPELCLKIINLSIASRP